MQTVGADPIVVPTRAVVTVPFKDFAVEHVSRLSLTRTYNSADASIRAGAPHGPLGRGWSHEWDSSLSCGASTCTVVFGAGAAMRFGSRFQASSMDGQETLDVYRAVGSGSTGDVLIRRPNGEWVLNLADGRELHFEVACDACTVEEANGPLCADPRVGGKARLSKVVDPAGNALTFAYDRPAGVFFRMADQLGHTLELWGQQACTVGLAQELRYGGATVAKYFFTGSDLIRAVDADVRVLRTYAYAPSSSGLLQAVQNEAGDLIAEFAYDESGRAIGISDEATTATVDYRPDGTVAVTEYYHGADGETSQTQVRVPDSTGRIASMTEGSSCGAAKTFAYSNGRLACARDEDGHIQMSVFDSLGRVSRRVEYLGESCPESPPASLPADSRDEAYEYSSVARREIAQGVTVDSKLVARSTRVSGYWPGFAVTTEWDTDSTQKASDPVGYRCSTSTLPAGSVICREIANGRSSTSAQYREERHATYYSYDGYGRLVRTIGPVELIAPASTDVTPVEERTYWPDDASPERRGRLHQVRRFPGSGQPPLVETYDYDRFGPSEIINARGGVTLVTRDGRGRPSRVTTPDGHSRETRYYDGLLPRVEVHPGGGAARSSYDERGRLRSVEHLTADPETGELTPIVRWSEEHVHDAAGNRIHSQRRDSSGLVTWQQDRAFDVRHRIVREVNPEQPSSAKTWTYDPAGRLTDTMDEESRSARMTHDGLGRVATVRRAGVNLEGSPVSQDVATYGYRPSGGELAWVKDARGQRTDYSFDDFGRVERVASPTMIFREVWYTHDARGNVRTRKIGSSGTAEFAYDGLDRIVSLIARNGMDGTSVSYTFRYDENGYHGHLTSIIEPERTTSFAYDSAGRVREESTSEAGFAAPLVVRYEYDANGAFQTIAYPSGLVVRYDRDPATGDVTRVSDAATEQAFAAGVVHLPGGPVRTLTFGNGLALSQAFDFRYEPVAVQSGPLMLTYVPGRAGGVNAIVDQSSGLLGAGRTRTFDYDFLDRLVRSQGWLEYGHDGAGNRTAETQDGVSATYRYVGDTGVPGDRLAERMVAATRTHAFGYDPFGAISGVSWLHPGGWQQAVCLLHDPLQRLSLVGWTYPAYAGEFGPGEGACSFESHVTTPIARFKYDARNRRVARLDAYTGAVKYTVFDVTGNPISELAATGDPAAPWSKVRDYVWIDGRPLAQIEYPGPQAGGPGYPYYFHLDAIGLPRALTNAAGNVVWSAEPRPFGELTESTSVDPISQRTVVTNLRLPGQYDERLLAGRVGLQGPYYNWNRWYLPGVGRYLELDPIAMGGGFNSTYGPDWYNYAGENPLRWTDPYGLLWAPPPPWWTGVLPWIGRALGILPGLLWPSPIGVEPCENSPDGCVGPKPGPGPDPGPGPGSGPGPGGGGGGRCPPSDPCRDQYNKDAGNCADWYTSADDTKYDACMDQAWKNYIRCLNGLPWQPMR